MPINWPLKKPGLVIRSLSAAAVGSLGAAGRGRGGVEGWGGVVIHLPLLSK